MIDDDIPVLFLRSLPTSKEEAGVKYMLDIYVTNYEKVSGYLRYTP